ncbi:hypothetical protein SteCoe_3740 [Stentor coeruleus]|uniref:Rap-GAP domain-containing protein n=1 Tax=Stentor coeruleus TaxID=5963 RepID=A0A1R2CWC0_9CILI|nr:hypothetical protein SteCoe_3740 [Stentor coeruleus]
MSNKMKNFASWFVGKSTEDSNKLRQIILDSSKSIRKRLCSLSALLKPSDKQSINPEKCSDFIKSNHTLLIELCVHFLRTDHTKNKIKITWEEISNTLRCLVDLTSYSLQIPIDTIQEIATSCLNETNRWELREYGFNLVLNLLNKDINLDVPNVLMLSIMDFKQLKSEETKGELFFIDRSSITSTPNNYDLLWINLVKTFEKTGESVQGKLINDLEKMTGTMNKGAKDCIFFFSKILDHAISFEGTSRIGQFKKWFFMLKQKVLYLIYPTFCISAPTVGHDWGFRDGFPPILHYIVVKWIVHIIKTIDLAHIILDNPEEFEFTINAIGESFKLTETYNVSSSESANIALKLYEDWVFQRNMTEYLKKNWGYVMCKLLEYPVFLFDYSQDASSRRVGLCKEFLKILNESKDKGLDKKILLDCSLRLSIKTIQTQDPERPFHDIVEPLAEFLISLLTESIELFYINWDNYTNILKNWSTKSEFIIQIWLEKMRQITVSIKDRQFEAGLLLDGWLSMFKILGDPLKFQERVQIKWVQALHELLVVIILNNPQESPSPNFMLDIFFMTLSKLIRQGAKETQRLSLVTLVTIFSNTKCQEIPYQCYLEHLCLLFYMSGEKVYLWSTLLESAYQVLEYPGMHFLIYMLLKIARNDLNHAFKFLFHVFCMPNYYGKTKLENNERDDLTYIDIKDSIKELLIKGVDNPSTAVYALHGLTIFILDELNSGNESISSLITSFLQLKCLSKDDEIAISSLNCLQTLSTSFPNIQKPILDFLINKCLQEIPNTKEKILKSILNTIQCWLLISNPTPNDDTLLSNLFTKLSNHILATDSSNSLKSEISTFISFISIYYLNYSYKNQESTVFNSTLSDGDFAEGSSVRPLHYSLGSYVIFTMIPHEEKAKFILRNQFGRFCWEAYDFMIFEPSKINEDIEKIFYPLKEQKIEFKIKQSPLTVEEEPLLPKLLKFIANTYPECAVEETNNDGPIGFLKMTEVVEEFIVEGCVEEKKQEGGKGQFNMGRYFLANLGLTDKLVPLQFDENFERGLGILDSLMPRESIKIGVIYVAPGQQDEKEILANSGGSAEFQDFLLALGDVVDIQNHKGNLGGLDPKGTAGKVSISYSDWQYDVIFHVVPLMPTDPSDDQQVLKKRHVGNDFVHIVWSEHYKDYRQDTMLTHFNLIIIVIYPLEQGFFRIQILKKVSVECGPLLDGMIIPAHLLTTLVRQTAINSTQQARHNKHPNFEKQLQIRKKNIQELIQKCPIQNPQKHMVYASMF